MRSDQVYILGIAVIPFLLFIVIGVLLVIKYQSYNTLKKKQEEQEEQEKQKKISDEDRKKIEDQRKDLTDRLDGLERWKDFLNRCIAFFAAPVIGGALLKILHLPLCNEALAFGLGAEAGIFIAVGLTVNTFELLDKQNGASETSGAGGKPKTGNTSEEIPTEDLKKSIISLTESLNTINQSLSSSDGKNIGTNLAELNTKVKEAREKLDSTFK